MAELTLSNAIKLSAGREIYFIQVSLSQQGVIELFNEAAKTVLAKVLIVNKTLYPTVYLFFFNCSFSLQNYIISNVLFLLK